MRSFRPISPRIEYSLICLGLRPSTFGYRSAKVNLLASAGVGIYEVNVAPFIFYSSRYLARAGPSKSIKPSELLILSSSWSSSFRSSIDSDMSELDSSLSVRVR